MKFLVKLICFVGIFWFFVGASASCGGKKNNEIRDLEQPSTSKEEISSEFACAVDSDCDVISTGCCDCSHGGKNQAVSKKYKQNILLDRKTTCKNIMCITVISDDSSCKKSQAMCEQNKCVLR